MYHRTILDNGLKIISEPMDHMRSVSLGIWVNAGSRDELEEESGISHFIEHMSFKGTKKRSSLQIAKELDAIGGFSNAFTGKEHTCFHAKVLSKDLKTLSDIFTDLFLNSSFDPEDLERERQVILQEINMVEDAPDENIHVIFNHLLWKDHPIGLSILGTDKTVRAIQRKDILRYMKQFYIPQRIMVVAAGNVNHDTLVSTFKPCLEAREGGRKSPERTIPGSHSRVSVQAKDLEQVHICLGGSAPSQIGEDRFAATLLNTILGGTMSSRLFQEIREKQGLAYVVYSFLSAYADTGMLGIYVASEARQVNPVLRTIHREIEKIKKGSLSASDLASAREHLIGSIYLGSESTDNRMMRNARNEFIFERYVPYGELVAGLEKVSVDEVIDVANRIFQDPHMSLAVLGPIREEALDRDSLSFH